MMNKQLPLPLPFRTARGRDAFFISDANAQAVAILDHPENWAQNTILLLGPSGSGKSHLAGIWADDHGATLAGDLGQITAETALPDAPLLIDDLDQRLLTPANETAMFHIFNHMRAAGLPMLITASTPPPQWGMTLPDLISRMEATQNVAIRAPDDHLLAAVLMKHFADRQLSPPPNLIPYLTRQMDRSFASAAQIVARLDHETLAQKRPLTRRLAAQIMAEGTP